MQWDCSIKMVHRWIRDNTVQPDLANREQSNSHVVSRIVGMVVCSKDNEGVMDNNAEQMVDAKFIKNEVDIVEFGINKTELSTYIVKKFTLVSEPE